MSGSSDRRYQKEVWITLVGLRRYVGGIVAQRSDKTKLVKKWYKNIIHSFRCRKLFHTNFSSNVDSDLNENSGGLMDLAKKKHGSADLRTPNHPPLWRKPLRTETFCRKAITVYRLYHCSTLFAM